MARSVGNAASGPGRIAAANASALLARVLQRLAHITFSTCLILLFQGTCALATDRAVEPLLQKYCLGCHNDTEREGGLSLQTNEAIKNGGDYGPVLNNDLRTSRLFQVLAETAESPMPPPDVQQPTPAERERLRRWILSGANIDPTATAHPRVPAVEPSHRHAPSLFALATSPDATLIATGGEGFVSLLDASTRATEWSMNIPGRATELSFAHNGEWLIVASGRPGISGRALVLSVADGNVVQDFNGHTDLLYAAQLSPTNDLIATAGYDRKILLHPVGRNESKQALTGHNGGVFSLSFSKTGETLCSASADGTVKVWNAATGQRLDTLSQPRAEQYSVHVSSDDQRIYAVGADNRLRIWKLASRTSEKTNPLLVAKFAHEQPIHSLICSPNQQLLATGADDGTIGVWSAWPLEHIRSLPRRTQAVTAMAFLGDSQLLLGHRDGSIATIPVNANDRRANPLHTDVQTQKHGIMSPSGPLNEVLDAPDNDDPATAQIVELPFLATGTINPRNGAKGDADCYAFRARAGQKVLFEVNAQRIKSPLDSRIEVLSSDGQRILRTRLQAVRDSYFTFRGKDSDNVNDFRVFNWQEMELNEYLYADGEVVRLWLYPRGPDSGFMVYPGFGKRHTYFGTTPTSHALQAPCFIVVPQVPDVPIVANGLPTFPIYFDNDDDPRRELGLDSRLHFTAPADGKYVVRVTDARGFSGADFSYQVTARAPQPSYKVKMDKNLKLVMQPGTGREIVFTVSRIDGYEGPITLDAANVPNGFAFSGPITIQSEQSRAMGVMYAHRDAVAPTPEQVTALRFFATTEAVGDQEIGQLEELKLLPDPKLRIRIGQTLSAAAESQEAGAALKIRAGETIRAMVQLERLQHNGVVAFGKEDAGRNLPHGVYVDNIGLNGLLLLAEQSEREFFITAAKWVPPGESTFYLKSNVDSTTSFPVKLTVLPQAHLNGEPNTRATSH